MQNNFFVRQLNTIKFVSKYITYIEKTREVMEVKEKIQETPDSIFNNTINSMQSGNLKETDKSDF